jgi:hypothetical protein
VVTEGDLAVGDVRVPGELDRRGAGGRGDESNERHRNEHAGQFPEHGTLLEV